jgi:hypothetical protein
LFTTVSTRLKTRQPSAVCDADRHFGGKIVDHGVVRDRPSAFPC